MRRPKTVSAAFAPKLPQTIQFESIGDRTLGHAPVPLVASSSSGLAVRFSVMSGAAAITNNLLTILGGGTIVLQAAVTVSRIAGSGDIGFFDAFVATKGALNQPDGPSIAAEGTIYFSDAGNNSVRFLTPEGRLGTLVGDGRAGFFNAIGRNALFSFPFVYSITRMVTGE